MNKEAHCRRDFLHELSTRPVREFDTLCLEDLNVKGMMANGSLARRIGQSGWAEFGRMVEHRTAWEGKHLRTLGCFEPSSRLCYCGWYNHARTLSYREWDCPQCGRRHDRGVLAANNVKRFA